MSTRPLDEVRLVDAYIDARHHEVVTSVPLDPALADLVDRLAVLPPDAWAPSAAGRPAEDAPRRLRAPVAGRTPVGVATTRRGARRVVAAAAVVVVLAGVLTAVALGGPGRPAPAGGWRLAGYIDQPGWQAQASAPAALAPTVACPSPGRCYAATTARAGAPVEGSSDGGGSWSATATPPSVWLTSGLSCPSPSSCAVAGETDLPADAGSPNGGVTEVLVTEDGGSTWSAWRLPPAVGEVSDLACTDLAHCVAVGLGLSAESGSATAVSAVTTDGGLEWATTQLPVGFVPRKLTGLGCPSPEECVLGGFDVDSAGVATPAALYSTDGGATWAAASLPTGLPAGTVWSVSCGASDACTALVPAVVPGAPAVGQSPSAAVSSVDGGRTWQPAAPFTGDPVLLTALSCVGPSSCWATGQRLAGGGGAALMGVVESTTDAGRSWTVEPVSGVGTGPTSIGTVTSVACAADGSCVALAMALGAGGTGQLVLRGPPAP